MNIEFEELQKIWDTQTNKPIYVMDEQALHTRIVSKQNQAKKITNISELLVIITNVASGLAVLALTATAQHPNSYMYLLSLWMILAAVYTVSLRRKRKAGENKFDRSLKGDLLHAVSVTSYQVIFSRVMQWNILPVAGFVFLGLWTSGKPVWIIVLTLLFFILTNLGGIWEHSIYKRKKRELLTLLSALDESRS